jgi:hypothetical protein
VRSSLFYRIAAVLLVLFAVGHTLGFRQIDPQWKVDSVVASMQAVHFDKQGFDRTYYDFYVGFGLFVSVLLLFAAAVTWQLAGLSGATLAQIPAIRWGLAVCFVAIVFLSWRCFFVVPLVFSSVITLCLVAGASLSRTKA